MYYTVGETIQIDVKFDQAVDVIAPPGTPPITAIGPRIRLNASATACFANLMPGAASGTGTDTLHFLYTVAPGHVTAALNYVGSGSLTLGGYRIVHTNLQLPRHDAIRTLPAPSAPGSLDWNENLQVALDSTAASAPVIKTQAWPLPVGGLAWTGVVIASGITTNPNIQVRGLETSPILATWEFSDDTGATWTPGSPGGSQLAPVGRSTFFLDDGTYPIGSVLVRQTDPSGNVSLVGSNPIAWTITADVSVLPPVLALGTGVANGATLAEAIQATGVVTVVGELNAIIIVSFAGALGSVTKTLTGTGVAQPVVLTAADVTTLGNGSVTVTATQTDSAGNVSGNSSINFTIDSPALNPPLFPWRQSPPSPIPNFRIPVTRIPLPFAAPLTGFSVSNLSLYLNGRLISLRGTIITGSGANYVIQLPSLATNLRGSYRLDVSGLSGMPAPYSYYFNRI